MDTEKEYEDDKNFTLRSRVTVFEREIERLKGLMYGRSVSVWQYMMDVWGKYSEEKIIGLVERIIDEDRYRKMHIWDFEQYADILPFYRNVLYCVLRVCTSDYTEYHDGNVFGYGKPEKILFSDILSAFEGSEQEFLNQIAVLFIERLYKIFTQKEIHLSRLNEGMEETEAENLQTDMPMEETEAEDIQTDISMEEMLAEELGYNIEEIREDERRFLEDEKRQAITEREKLYKQFAAKEHFCRSTEEIYAYLKRASISFKQMHSEIKTLIDGFLFENGLCVFQDEDEYVEVMVQLKKTIRTAQRYTGDGK